MKEDNIVEVNTVDIGGVIYNKDQVTPSVYFEYVKGLKQQVEFEEYDYIIDNALKMLKKTVVTGQTDMAKRLTHQIELALRELNVAKKGFNIFVNRKDIERYIQEVDQKVIKVIELSRYSREIPDDVIDKIAEAKELFDQLYIVFTDYTSKETKKVAKERRDKDPIVFGAFKETDEDTSKPYLEDRFFFIADWVDDKCDLTLESIVRDIQDKEDRIITYKVSTSNKDEDAVKKYLESFSQPVSDMEPTTIFEKIKKALPAPTKKRGLPRKKKEE